MKNHTRAAAAWLAADHGPQIRAAVQAVASLAALAFCLGAELRQWIEQLNADLAAFHSRILAPTTTAPQVPALVSPTGSTAASLAALTVRELRAQARAEGLRQLARSGKKAQLIAALAGA